MNDKPNRTDPVLLATAGAVAILIGIVAMLSHGGSPPQRQSANGGAPSASSTAGRTPPTTTESATPTEPSAATEDASSSDDPISGVTAEQVGPHAYRVSWTNPHDPAIAGWIITDEPSEDSSDSLSVPKPAISSEEVTDADFEPQLIFFPGQDYTICITPFGYGLNPKGGYPEMLEREACAPPFTWT